MKAAAAPGMLPAGSSKSNDKLLFWGCFVALVATAFAFSIRANVAGEWQHAFGLSETEKGEILGAMLWPFGLSIVLFSLVVDRIGYGLSMVFAFACHIASVVVTIYATGYDGLYIGSCLGGLAAGTVEAVVNPVVATMFAKNKTKMLTILHAGWAGGIALCGLIVVSMAQFGNVPWQIKVLLLLVPTLLYGVMMLCCKFPVNERVAAGVPYRAMLRECGILGSIVISFMLAMQIVNILQAPTSAAYIATGIVAVAVGLYTGSLGRLMYTFFLLIMVLLAITELGTDGWMKDLRDPAMKDIGLDGGWILVYTATIMMVLRFMIGPVVKVLKPLGVLLGGSLFAAAGLYFLSGAEGAWMILITATIYGIGQAYFWPVTLGVISERFPKGGAWTLNAIAGVGMLGVGIIGFPLIGYLQDLQIETRLETRTALRQEVMQEEPKTSIFGTYSALDVGKVNNIEHKVKLHEYREKVAEEKPNQDIELLLVGDQDYVLLVRNAYEALARPEGDTADKSYAEMAAALEAGGGFGDRAAEAYGAIKEQNVVLDEVRNEAAKSAMAQVALLPITMAVCYIGLMIYFKIKGGYKAIELTSEKEQETPSG